MSRTVGGVAVFDVWCARCQHGVERVTVWTDELDQRMHIEARCHGERREVVIDDTEIAGAERVIEQRWTVFDVPALPPPLRALPPDAT